MHILLIHQAFAAPDDAGGTRHYEICSRLVSRGHQVTVVTSPLNYLSGQAAQAQSQTAPFNILYTRTRASLHHSFFSRLLNFFSFMVSAFFTGMSVQGVDVVWGTTPPLFQTVSAWLVARLKRAAFVLEVRDLWPVFAIDTGVLTNKLLIWFSYGLEKFMYARADRIVVNSPGFVDYISGRTQTPIILIPNGVDVSQFDPNANASEARTALGLEDKFVAMYAGAHGLANDLVTVVEAAALLRQNDRVRVVLVGDGKDKPALVEQARSLDLQNLIFLPAVPKREMAATLAMADAGIATLKAIPMFKTTYPNKVFDYMAAGKPVLLAIQGVIEEVVTSADCGIAVEPGNAPALARAIKQLADDPAASQQMGLNGRRAVEQHFDRELAAGQFETLFREVTR